MSRLFIFTFKSNYPGVNNIFRIGFSVSLLLLIPRIILAECDSTFLGNDLFVCEGESVILDAGDGYFSYLWSNGSTGQTITVSEAGTFWCTVTYVDSANNVINGNFSLGNYGFGSDYNYNPTSVYSEGTYAITTNPLLVHPDFANCGDHTSGNGQMMVVNGAPYPNQNVWFETLPVNPNTDYHYSGWFMSVHPDNPAVLELSINGTPIQEVNLSGSTCNWQNFYNIWNSGSNTSISLQIVNQNTIMSGNDFAIDDINLFEACIITDSISVTFVPDPEVNLGPDTTFCDGDSLMLIAGFFQTITWQDGSNYPYLYVTESGEYWVSVANEYGCTNSDTVLITVTPLPDITLGNDTTLCEGETLILIPGNGYSSYLWQDNSTSSTFVVTGPGTYWVTVSNDEACAVTDTIHVTYDSYPQIELGEDISACEGEPVVLTPGSGFLSYLWQDGSTGPNYTVLQNGLFWVTVSNQCEEATDSVYVTFNPIPEPYLGEDTVICEGEMISLQTSGLFAG